MQGLACRAIRHEGEDIMSMKHRSILLFFLGAILCPMMSVYGQVTITDNNTAAQLVEKLIGNGVSYSNPVLNCEPGANGIFNVLSSNLGLDSGIVLTSGNASDDSIGWTGFGTNSPAFELADTDYSNGGMLQNGDAQLDSLLAPGGVTSLDACVLEFDFIPTGDTLQFRYVFGSEEYTSFSCDIYNDIFAFFLTGPGYPQATNIALIPGTTIPVAVNSTTDTLINFAFDPSLCTAMGPGSPFSQYYVDNLSGTTIVYNGFTSVFTAMAPVQACSTYHIKLAIADAADGLLDSGVFLEAGSFTSNATSLSFVSNVPGNTGALMEGCLTGTITVRRKQATNQPQTVYLFYSGTAAPNVDFGPAPDSVIIPAFDSLISFTVTAMNDAATEGIELVGIRTQGSCANAADSMGFSIIEQLPLALISNDTSFCEGTVTTIPLIADGDPAMSFTWTASPAVPIQNHGSMAASATVSTNTTFTVTAGIPGCNTSSQSFDVSFTPLPVVDIHTEDTTVCLQDSMLLFTTVTPGNAGYTYIWSPLANLSNPSVKEPAFLSRELADHRYYLTVVSPEGCAGSDSILIHSKPGFDLTDVTANATIKYGEQIQLNATGGRYYTWYPDQYLNFPNTHDPIASPKEPTLFTVYALNEWGCRDTATVFVDIDYAMVEIIPSAFSPNGDGKNDVFRVSNIRFQRLLEFRIFNRWGQEVYSTTDATRGWDGRFNGQMQDPGVYHYLIRVALPNGENRQYKGDVTLIR